MSADEYPDIYKESVSPAGNENNSDVEVEVEDGGGGGRHTMFTTGLPNILIYVLKNFDHIAKLC